MHRRSIGNTLMQMRHVQPDVPRLCRFWLEAIISGLATTAELHAFWPCQLLATFLWKYRFVAVPEYLRALLRNLSALCARLDGARKLPRSSRQEDRTLARHSRNFLFMCKSGCSSPVVPRAVLLCRPAFCTCWHPRSWSSWRSLAHAAA
jgi:hypothetical protein